MPKYCAVALLSPPYSTLHYSLPPWWPAALHAKGTRVAVPLGKGALRVGVLTETSDTLPADIPAGVTVRPLVWPLEDAPLLSPQYMDMAQQLALRQCCTMGHILGHLLPQGLRTTKVRLRHFVQGKVQWYTLKSLQNLDATQSALLSDALAVGAASMLPHRTDAAADEVCQLMAEPPWPVRPMATRQIAVLEHLLRHGDCTRRALLTALGTEAQKALDTLVEHGHVHLTSLEAQAAAEEAENTALLPPPPQPFTLSPAQQDAVTAFQSALDAGQTAAHVLFGVTGSGKTAVYMRLAQECLARGKSLLLLAPEVALALKLFRDTRCALPDAPVLLYHGYQSPVTRERTFRELARQPHPCVCVGTRSALFLPLQGLGAIVLDEEHDASFKQEEQLTYQAKEVAYFLAAQHRALLVLGSATPDIKTFYAAQQGHIPLARLPERVGGGTLPTVRLVDISKEQDGEEMLAAESLAAIKDTVARGEQVVILLNRRGYAPLMYCLDCQRVAKCPHCDISLTYHKSRQRLVCHYCGYSTPFPAVCPHCKGSNYLPMGGGTEKLAESLPPLVGTDAILRMDRDSTRRPGLMDDILQAFARQDAQILVGTQMLSKGHHFPNVTLAVVADADLGLNLPDYRAAERTFQLLVQSSGRAGRGAKAGEVLIQTRDTTHYCWEFVKNADYEQFYAAELSLRQKYQYPPFTRLALIRISHAVDAPQGAAAVSQLGQHLRTQGRTLGLMVLGPSPAPIALLRGRKRFNCLIKGQDWLHFRQLFQAVCADSEKKLLRISLDLDPVNML